MNVFRNEACSVENTYWSIITAMKDFEDSMGALSFSNSTCKEIKVHWMTSAAGWIKVNVDGASCEHDGAAGCGGVFCDSEGKWIIGFSRGLGALDDLSAEVWGIFTGLQLAWMKGFRHICIETDSTASIDLIGKGCTTGHPLFPLIHNINELRSREWTVELRRCYRENNGAVDWLASFALRRQLDTMILEDPPDSLLSILERDLDLNGYSRWVSFVG